MLKIAIVNDSLTEAEGLRRVINGVPAYQLLWVARDGREALNYCSQQRPDIVLMDLIMPHMDGIEATRRITAEFGCAILVVTATVNGHAGRVFEAMGAGALDAVNTPVLGETGHASGEATLLHKVNTIAKLLHGKPLARHRARPGSPSLTGLDSEAPALIAIGASTGGPGALVQVLGALPADLPAAISIVQHVDEQFMPSFISWLNQQSPLPVRAAAAGDRFQCGEVLVCGRENHLTLRSDARLEYSIEPASLAYRPSVDAFFASLAQYAKNQSVGVLLTGMGKDGAAGLQAMRQRGWHTIAQDQHSSAVYGMPKAAKEIDAAVEILPLERIGPALARWAQQAASTSRGGRTPA
jgi:two-component system response regulator WspF